MSKKIALLVVCGASADRTFAFFDKLLPSLLLTRTKGISLHVYVALAPSSSADYVQQTFDRQTKLCLGSAIQLHLRKDGDMNVLAQAAHQELGADVYLMPLSPDCLFLTCGWMASMLQIMVESLPFQLGAVILDECAEPELGPPCLIHVRHLEHQEGRLVPRKFTAVANRWLVELYRSQNRCVKLQNMYTRSESLATTSSSQEAIAATAIDFEPQLARHIQKLSDHLDRLEQQQASSASVPIGREWSTVQRSSLSSSTSTANALLEQEQFSSWWSQWTQYVSSFWLRPTANTTTSTAVTSRSHDSKPSTTTTIESKRASPTSTLVKENGKPAPSETSDSKHATPDKPIVALSRLQNGHANGIHAAKESNSSNHPLDTQDGDPLSNRTQHLSKEIATTSNWSRVPELLSMQVLLWANEAIRTALSYVNR